MKRLFIFAIIIFVSLRLHAQNASQTKDSSASIKLISAAPSNKSALPLYIVDGKNADTAYVRTLNPAMIESIEVLKDKQAIKQYGKKGENGVIIIKTKKDILLGDN